MPLRSKCVGSIKMATDSKKLLSNYLIAMIKGFVQQAKSLSSLEHKVTKGQLREIFTQNLLKHFLPSYLNVGSGVIINNRGDQSKQTDIIIFDNRVLPAFLFSENLNIFPVESVVSVIELKSLLDLEGLKKAEEDAKHLIETVRQNNNWITPPPPHLILPCLFSLGGDQIRVLSTDDNTWINENINYLRYICSVGKFSWVRIYFKKEDKLNWVYGPVDDEFAEIRRFIAVLVDNLRTTSTQNWLWSSSLHNDWLSQYIRE